MTRITTALARELSKRGAIDVREAFIRRELRTESATPHEVTLAVSTLLQMVVPDAPQNLNGDDAYDSDRLDAELRLYGIEVIAPHRRNRRNSTQDGRRLKRYRRRWKIERRFAWLQNFRRLVVRNECHAENFLGMLQLASSLILLRHFMRWVLESTVMLLYCHPQGR
jgi:transposase